MPENVEKNIFALNNQFVFSIHTNSESLLKQGHNTEKTGVQACTTMPAFLMCNKTENLAVLKSCKYQPKYNNSS